MIRDFFKLLLQGFAVLWSVVKECCKVLRAAWKFLLRKSYGALTGTKPESDPTLFEVLVTLKVVISGLPQKQRWAAYAGCIAAVAAVGLLLGAALTSTSGSTGKGTDSGGSSVSIGNHTYYQPEFSKLDCLTCDGDGDCNTCRGYGEVERYAGAGDTVRAKCSSCYGSGNCRTCGGSGKR